MATILIAEDNACQLRVLSMWLARNGHVAVEAHNGREAQAKLANGTSQEGQAPGGDEDAPQTANTPDLIITDANMPEVGGVELARWVRATLGPVVPILMLSARCDQESLDGELAELGVTLIPKPFSPTRIMAEIERLLAAASARKTPESAPSGAGAATERGRTQGAQ